MNNLPICYTILDHIPEETNSDFYCKYHQTKKIKYFCSLDQDHFCSICLTKHTKINHKVIKFNPKKVGIENEIKIKEKLIKEEVLSLTNHSKKVSEIKIKMLEITKSQLESLDNETNRIINFFKQQKTMIEEKIKNLYKKQIEVFDKVKKNIGDFVNNYSSILQKYNILSTKITKNDMLIYDDILVEKNKLNAENEHFLKALKKNSTISFQSLIIPKFTFEREKILQATKDLIQFNSSTINPDELLKDDILFNINCKDIQESSYKPNDNKNIPRKQSYSRTSNIKK